MKRLCTLYFTIYDQRMTGTDGSFAIACSARIRITEEDLGHADEMESNLFVPLLCEWPILLPGLVAVMTSAQSRS